MRKLVLLLLALLIAVPAYAYRIDAVKEEPRATDVSGGTVAISTAGTAVQLASSWPKTTKVILMASPSNLGNTYVGNQWVEKDSHGVVLGHGNATTSRSVELSIDDISNIYVNSGSTGSVDFITELQ